MVQPLSLAVRNEKGKVNGIALAEQLGISVPKMAKVLGITPQALGRNPTSERIQTKANQLEFVYGKLLGLVGKETHALAWLNAIYPSLGYPPMQLILEGDIETLDNILEEIMEGIPG